MVSNIEYCLSFQLGEKGSGLKARGQVQDFFKIRDQCLEKGTLFEDPEFPAEDTSIFLSKTPPRPFEWKRPMVSWRGTVSPCHDIADGQAESVSLIRDLVDVREEVLITG
jgi:hypothetical protein